MIRLRFVPLVLKQAIRHRTRSLLTVLGVASAMCLFCGVEALQAGAEAATKPDPEDTTLIVYRKDRYCPFTSRMPQSYEERIRRIPGVAEVVPTRITVSNCRTSLDVVTFRGTPADDFLREYAPKLTITAGSLSAWENRTDAAIASDVVARRRGLSVGDRFNAAGVTVYIAAIFRAIEPQQQNSLFVHLPFLQAATGTKQGGYVTQFNVRVERPELMRSVAAAIDADLAPEAEPSRTGPEKDFVARAASDVLEIVRFTKWLGWGCLAAILALLANSIVLAVQDRIREHAVMQTLGFSGGLIGRLIISESTLIALVGGLAGAGIAALAIWRSGLSLSVEGLTIPILLDPGVVLNSFAVAVVLGVVAGIVPALQASRRPIVECLRSE